jgi:hypothetical protein
MKRKNQNRVLIGLQRERRVESGFKLGYLKKKKISLPVVPVTLAVSNSWISKLLSETQ